MTKSTHIRTALLLAATCALLTSPVLAGARAVVAEPVIDLGTVARGDKVEHRFELENTGDATLTVREVKAACGCTVMRFDKTIAPGATGAITAALDTRNISGSIAKSVTVFTTDPENPRLNLVIKANIQPQVEVRPGYARFIVVEGKGSSVSKQTLWAAAGPSLEVTAVRSPFPFVKAESRRSEREGRWDIVLTLDRNRAPVGPMADFVEVETNHPKQRLVKIPISGFVRPVVSVMPSVAELGSRELTEPFTATLEVRNQTNEKIAVESVSTDVAGVGAEIREVEAGKLYSVVLTLEPGMAKGPFTGKVQISTTSSRRPTLEVDLSGTVL